MTPAQEIEAFIGLGANLGDAAQAVRQAIVMLGNLPRTRLEGCSSLFRTAPVDASGGDYVNAVARLRTRLEPEALLRELQAIETAFGRERPYPNAPRTLDLDILLYGQLRMDSPTLTVPHPRMTERAFALIPLLQLDPFIFIPGKGPAHEFAAEVAGQKVERIQEQA